MRKTVKSSLFKLVSLVLALTLMVSVFAVAAGTMSVSAGDDASNIVEAEEYQLELFATFGGTDYLPYSPDKWASGFFKVVAEVDSEGYSLNHAFYKKSSDTEWVTAGVFAEESGKQKVLAATPEEAKKVREIIAFQILPDEEEPYDGSYDLLLSYSSDTSEKSITLNKAVKLRYDNKIDEFTVSSDKPDEGYASSVKISGKCSDLRSGIKSFSYSTSDGSKKDIEITDGKYEIELNESFVGDVTFYAEDNAGNRAATSVSGIKIDPVAPTVSIDDTEERWANDEIVVTGEAADDASGVDKVHYAIIESGKEVKIDPSKDPVADYNSAFDSFEATIKRPADGKFNVVFYAVDKAGNLTPVSTDFKGASINFDTKECRIVELKCDRDDWTAGEITISGKIRDDDSGFDPESVKDSVKFAVTDPSDSKGAWTVVDESKLNDDGDIEFSVSFNDKDGKHTQLTESGEYKVEFTAADKAGNGATLDEALASSITYPFVIKIDRSEPELDESSVEAFLNNGDHAQENVYTNAPVTVKGRFTEEQSVLSKVTLTLENGKSFDSKSVKRIGSSKVFEFELEIPAGETYTGGFKLTGFDDSGNGKDADVTGLKLYLDNTAPELNLSDVKIDESGWAKKAVLSGKAYDSEAGIKAVYYRKSGTAEWKEVPSDKLGLSADKKTAVFSFETEPSDNYDGEYDIMAEDSAGEPTSIKGNIRTLEKGGHVYIDNTEPKIESVTAEYSGDWTNGDISFTVKAVDVGEVQSGVKTVMYSFASNDKYPKSVDAVRNSDGDYEFTVKAEDLTVEKGMDGGYVGDISAVAVDNAGNESVPKLISVKIDTEKGIATAVTKDFAWTNQPLPITVSYIDNASAEGYNSGYSKYEYAMNDDVWKSDITPSVSADEYTFTFPARNYNSSYRLKFYDKAGNSTELLAAENAKQDITAPEIKAESLNVSEVNWTNGGIVITGKAEDLGIEGTENNSGIASIYFRKEGASWTELVKDDNNDPGIDEAAKTAAFTVSLPADDYNGKYELMCKDAAGNSSAAVSVDVKQDKTAPVVTDSAVVSPAGWTRGEVILTGSLTDTGNPEIGYNSGIDKVYYKRTSDTSWTELDQACVTTDDISKTATYTITVPAQDYRGTYDLKCTDKAGNTSADVTLKNPSGDAVLVKQDTKAPVIKVRHTEPQVWKTILNTITLGFFNIGKDGSDDLDYELLITDELSGINTDSLVISYTDEDGFRHEKEKLADLFDLTVNKNAYNNEGSPVEVKVLFTVKAKSGASEEIKNMYLEDVSFDIKDLVEDAEQNTGTGGENGIQIVDTVDPTRTVKYSVPVNPSGKTDPELGDNVVSKDDTLYYNGSASLTFTVNEKNFFPVKKANGELKPECSFTVTRNSEAFTGYELTEWTDNNDGTYTAVLTIGDGAKDGKSDGTYRVDFDYKDYSGNKMEKFESAAIIIDDSKPTCSVNYSNKDIINNIDGIDYFRGNQSAEIKITEDNFDKNDVVIEIAAKNSKGDSIADSYILADWQDVGNEHYLVINFNADANYTLSVKYTDLAENKMDDYNYVFTIDNEAPVLTSIKYGDSVRDVVNSIISGVTFGFYNAPVTVDLEYFDATSGCCKFNREGVLAGGVSSINKAIEKYISDETVTSENGVTKLSLTIPAEALTEKNNFNGYFNALMVDRSGNSGTSKGQQTSDAADNSRRLVIDTISPKCSIAVSEPINEKTVGGKDCSYYDGSIKGKITVDEANFYEDDVVFKIDNTVYKLNWSSANDIRTADFTISSEGVHSYYFSYKDRSGNDGGELRRDNLIIDLTDPKVNVEYHNKNRNNPTSVTENGREYYGSAQTATVTVTETNFDSDDVKLIVSATDSDGNTVSSPYSTGNWSSSGDIHTLDISYSKDANYTFDIEYQDLAKRSIADYSPDLFTVDATAPQTIGFSFSSPVNTSNGKQFYNAPVTVTITCYDATSGVDTFDYEGILASNASSSNAAVVKTAIANANITKNGGTSTATFTLPASALSSLNQFDGTVTAAAHDRSGNTTTTANATRLVADNVAPTATMQASSAVQSYGGNRYYSGNITISLSVTEANFSDADTVFTVDGSPASVVWSSNGDVHTASYTITGDGKHSCSLSCRDASNNSMSELTEQNMVIDTKKPEIVISDSILNTSANNGQKLSFTLTVTDDNMISDSIKPELTAVVTEADSSNPQDSVSKLVEKKIDLQKTSDDGKVFVFSIDNLSSDGFYTFKCTATDLAGNSSSDVKCKDSGNKDASVETFNFSVNRNGSTFWVDSNVTNDTYTNSNDISVALHEINIDKMSDGTSLRIVDDNASRNVSLDNTNFVENRPANRNYGGWYESVYSLDNSYFEADSRYSVIATSHDTAGNINVSSDSELSVISFIVDRTAPVITSNVSDNQSINATDFDVEFKIADINPDKNSIDVKLNGKTVPYDELSGGSFSFTIGSGMGQDIEINVSDLASNKAETYTVKGITVSTNPFVRWFANKVLFFSTTGGAVLLAGLAVFLILFNKKRKGKTAA